VRPGLLLEAAVVVPPPRAASGAARVAPLVWVSAAWWPTALITTIGFILSCTQCFMLAVRGLRT
jgi:hypothetical protein